MSGEALPEWPVTDSWYRLGADRQWADAWEARCRLLAAKAAVVVNEYRREFAPGELADVDELEKALADIGPLPAFPSPKEQRT